MNIWKILESMLHEIDFEDHTSGDDDDPDAGVWPAEHFDPDEVNDPDGFEEIIGTVGTPRSSGDGPMHPQEVNSVLYHPKHWDVVSKGEFPEGRLDLYWYRTDTDGYVALRAKSAAARKFLQRNRQWNTIGRKNPSGVTRKGDN